LGRFGLWAQQSLTSGDTPVQLLKGLGGAKAWHSLSDPALEEALRLGMDTQALAPALTIGCRMRVPDETTRWAPENGRFRNLLIHQGKGESLFQEVDFLGQKVPSLI